MQDYSVFKQKTIKRKSQYHFSASEIPRWKNEFPFWIALLNERVSLNSFTSLMDDMTISLSRKRSFPVIECNILRHIKSKINRCFFFLYWKIYWKLQTNINNWNNKWNNRHSTFAIVNRCEIYCRKFSGTVVAISKKLNKILFTLINLFLFILSHMSNSSRSRESLSTQLSYIPNITKVLIWFFQWIIPIGVLGTYTKDGNIHIDVVYFRCRKL